jgi:hypothetical protein
MEFFDDAEAHLFSTCSKAVFLLSYIDKHPSHTMHHRIIALIKAKCTTYIILEKG